jgi:hypothetical protein
MKIGITGHQRLDNEAAWPWVKGEIENVIVEHPDAEGVSSLAIGADQLFAELVLSHHKKLRVIIPCEGYERTFDADDINKYRLLLSKASEKVQLDFLEPSEEAFYSAGKKLADISDIVVAVWNGKPAKGLGGTADVVSYANKLGKKVLHLNPETLEAHEI